MKVKFLIILFLSILSVNKIYSQLSIRDSSISLNSLSFNFSFLFPAKDMAQRFGTASQISAQFLKKTKSNILGEFSFAYIFGNHVNDSFVLDKISTSEGYIINLNGLLCPVSIEERGFNLNFSLGYLIPVFGPNPNSGFTISIGSGFIQHKIFFDYSLGPVYQLENDYKKGYDRLTNGFNLIQKVGYQRFGNAGLGNFHFSLFMIEGFTKNRRDFDYYLMKKLSDSRIDVLIGINLGFDIPVYRKTPKDFFLN